MTWDSKRGVADNVKGVARITKEGGSTKGKERLKDLGEHGRGREVHTD